jgi:hypothetical protein
MEMTEISDKSSKLATFQLLEKERSLFDQHARSTMPVKATQPILPPPQQQQQQQIILNRDSRLSTNSRNQNRLASADQQLLNIIHEVDTNSSMLTGGNLRFSQERVAAGQRLNVNYSTTDGGSSKMGG